MRVWTPVRQLQNRTPAFFPLGPQLPSGSLFLSPVVPSSSGPCNRRIVTVAAKVTLGVHRERAWHSLALWLALWLRLLI